MALQTTVNNKCTALPSQGKHLTVLVWVKKPLIKATDTIKDEVVLFQQHSIEYEKQEYNWNISAE